MESHTRSSLRHRNPVKVAMQALAREGVYVSSRTGHNIAPRDYPRSWQLRDLLPGRKSTDDAVGHQMARLQWQHIGSTQAALRTPTQHKQMPAVPGPGEQRCAR